MKMNEQFVSFKTLDQFLPRLRRWVLSSIAVMDASLAVEVFFFVGHNQSAFSDAFIVLILSGVPQLGYYAAVMSKAISMRKSFSKGKNAI